MAVWWLLPAALGVARVQERQDPHLRWSQAPPRPWRRPGSADIKYIDFPSLLYDLLLFFQPWPREDSLGILGPAQRPRFPALSAVVAEAGERYGRWQSHECSEHGHLG